MLGVTRYDFDEQAETHLREAWEHESSKDEMNVVLQGLEQHFWRGTEAGWPTSQEKPGRGMDRSTSA
jgi:hypothetical protein